MYFFSKYHPLLDNEHVGRDGPLRLGQDGPYIMHCVYR